MPVGAVFIGFGARGQIYARYAAEHPDQMTIAAVAEPRAYLRRAAAEEFGCPEDRVYRDWESMLAAGVPGEAVFICTQDNEHVRPALAAIQAGYAYIMLEKPIDRDIRACIRLMETAKARGASVQVCHTLRYMPIFRRLKSLLDDGAAGELMHLSLLEGYGYFQFAHSYVRGDWSNAETSSPLLLAKCCHDADMIYYLTGKRWKAVSSFGELTHFREEHAPPESAPRCADCPLTASCAFSAARYGDMEPGSPLRRNAVEKEGYSSLQEALAYGRYGRCVYRCGNTAVDHQTVNIRLEGGITANLTVSGFSTAGRRLHLMGTKGEIFCDVSAGTLRVRGFADGGETVIALPPTAEHHGGADRILVQEFLQSVRGSRSVTDIAEAIESHTLCDAAERARVENRVVFADETSYLEAPGRQNVNVRAGLAICKLPRNGKAAT